MRTSFAEAYPEIAKEWSDRNLPLTPDQVSYGSTKKAWWKGECGHEWQARVADRTAGSQCPCCSDVIIVPGINDLATKYPDIASEWSDKNDKPASQVSPRADY